jgi:hypothetical protein
VAKNKKPPSPETPSAETQPAPLKGTEKETVGMAPWAIFRTALKAFPPLKYALAVLGIVSAIAVIKGFGIDFRVAVFGTIIMMVLMSALVVFASLTKVKSPQVRAAAYVMMWAFLALTILSAGLLFTSAFFDIPKPLMQLFGFADEPVKMDPNEMERRRTILIWVQNENIIRRPFLVGGVDGNEDYDKRELVAMLSSLDLRGEQKLQTIRDQLTQIIEASEDQHFIAGSKVQKGLTDLRNGIREKLNDFGIPPAEMLIKQE